MTKTKSDKLVISGQWLVMATVVMLLATDVGADTFTWNADAAGNWNNTTATGWNSGAAGYPDAADDVAIFSLNIVSNRTITINVNNATVGAMTLTDTVSTQNWTIASSAPATNKLNLDVTAGAATIHSTTNSNIISAPVVLWDPVDVTVTGTLLTISGAITEVGAQSLTLAAGTTGTLRLSGTNTYTGATTVNAGTLEVSGNTAIADSSAVLLANAAGAQLTIVSSETIGSLAGGGASGGNVMINANQTLTVGANDSSTSYNGVISGSGTNSNLVKTGAGTFTLGGNNTYGGTTTVNAGVLAIGASERIANTSNLVVSGTGMFDIGTFNETVGTVTVSATSGGIGGAGGTLTGTSYNLSNTTGAHEISAILAGSANLAKTGAGTSTLSAANTYTGTTAISSNGFLIIRHAQALGSSFSGTTVAANSTLALEYNINVTGETLTVTGGGGTLRSLSGNNTWGTTIVLSADGRIQSDADLLTVAAVGIGTNNDLTLDGAGDGVVNGAIALGTATLTKSGTGVWELKGTNTYGGTTTITGGTLALSGSGNISTGRLVLNGGVLAQGTDLSRPLGTSSGTFLHFLAGGSGGGFAAYGADIEVSTTTVNPIWASTTAFLPNNAAFIFGGPKADHVVTWSSNFSLGNGSVGASREIRVHDNPLSLSDWAVLSGNISSTGSGAFGINKTGDGKLVLEGTNSYNGATLVSAGVLNIRNSSALGTTAGGVDVSDGAALEMQGGIAVGAEAMTLRGAGVGGTGALRNVSGTNSWAGGVTLALDSTIAVEGAGDTLTLAGAVGQSGGTRNFTKIGVGTLVLSNAGNSYTGTAFVTAGTLALGAANVLPDASSVWIDGGTLDIGAFSDTVSTVTLVNGTITGTTGVLSATTFDIRSGTVNAMLNGGAVLNKTTPGTATFTGVSNYTGATTISNGILLMNGSVVGAGGAVNVAGTGVLGGSGTIERLITGDGRVDPGNSPGILTVNQFDPTAGLDWSFEFTGAAPDFDQPLASINDVMRITDLTSPFTAGLTSANEIDLYFNMAVVTPGLYLGGFYTDRNADFLADIAGATFNLYKLDALGAITYQGNQYSVLSMQLTVSTTDVPGTQFSGVDGYIMRLSLAEIVIPEPVSGLVLFSGMTLLALRRRGRSR